MNARGDQVVLHPVLAEFSQLMDIEPIVRMHLSEMIAQVPRGKQYSARHIQDVPELLRLINEVLTMAPEFGDQKRHAAAQCDPGLDDGDLRRIRCLP